MREVAKNIDPEGDLLVLHIKYWSNVKNPQDERLENYDLNDTQESSNVDSIDMEIDVVSSTKEEILGWNKYSIDSTKGWNDYN